jgi:hypothetical protein
MVESCDVKSYELAQHFLLDELTSVRPELAQRLFAARAGLSGEQITKLTMNLALTIQTAVEDWFQENGLV